MMKTPLPVMASALTAVAAVFLSFGAAAQDAGPPAGAKPQAWQQHCQSDVDKHCKEAIAKGTVAECLAAKEDDLSEACQKSFLYKYKVAQTCKEDIKTVCKPKVEAGMTLGDCFRNHRKEFSQKCQDAIAKGSKQWKSEKKAEAKAEAASDGTAAPEAKPAKKKRKAAP